MQAFHRTTILAAVLALLIGPQWCCCSMRALTGSRPAATASCCPCCGGAAAETRCADADRTADHDGDHGGHRCPCRAKQRNIAVAGVQIEQRSLMPGGPVLAGIAMAWPDRERVAIAHVNFSGWPAPLAGRSRLSMLGVLRC
jgi:hypothetical protein